MMFLQKVFIFLGAVTLVASQNSTDDLEVRVTILENDVINLQDDVEEAETDNNLQDERLNTMELILNENSNDIDDLVTSVDQTQDGMDTLQEEVAILKATNTLLLQRLSELETVLNATTETVQDLDDDIQDANTRLTAVEEDVAMQQEQIEAVEQSDTEQNDRMSILEDVVDIWDDRIVALEVTDTDMQGRLFTLEEIILTPWVACDSSPCDNGGTCVDVNVDTFICMCRDGYHGENCQNTPFEACSSSPCGHGGSCVDVNVDTFVCLCRDGYFGMTCEESYAGTSFLASFDYDPGTPGDPIIFNVAPLNPGGYYDVTTGIYTVPVDGVYEFIFHAWIIDDASVGAHLEVDGVHIFRTISSEADYSDPFMDFTVLLSLTFGQQVWISPNSISGMQGIDSVAYESWFAGHLVSAL